MSNSSKEVIDVLNNLIEYSKDGEKGFKEAADDVKNPELKAFCVQRASDCSSAVSELQAEVRRLGGDPETSTSITGDLHRGWVNLKSMLTGKDDKAVLEELERGEDAALKAYKDAREKLAKLGHGDVAVGHTTVTSGVGTTSLGDTTLSGTTATTAAASGPYALVERQLQGVQRNHDQVKALRDQARARS
ncbi:ferritin-like domain-containing protein [Pseudomonas fulva]|nr:PA2169 family four-helix-bundle protein [Pseudomonas fulva]MBF8779506.1 PA2169 family four-helix-bundle protein [Pseudomonas fulva]